MNIPLSFLHSCSDKCCATFLKILGPGHLRSGHRVRSSDPTSEKNFPIASRPQWWRERFETFRIWFTTKYVHTCSLFISDIFYIGDLRSGQLCELPFISQWGKNSNASKSNTGMRSRDIFGRFRLRLRGSNPAPAPAPSKTVRRLQLRLRAKCTGSGGSGSDDQVLI